MGQDIGELYWGKRCRERFITFSEYFEGLLKAHGTKHETRGKNTQMKENIYAYYGVGFG